MAGRDPKPPSRSAGLDVPYALGDTIPAPDVVEVEGDTAWALFSEISRQHDDRFVDTAPAITDPSAGPPSEPTGWAPTRPLDTSPVPLRRLPDLQPLFTLEAAMLVARRNNRVCPRPERWQQLMALLPPRKTSRGVQHPPPPIVGTSWHVTPPLTKRLCFREQIEWADRGGVLESVMAFMQALPEDDWLHMGED